MKKQTRNLAIMSFLVAVIMIGGVFAQPYFTSTKEYKPLPLPESKKPLPYDGDPTIIVTNTNDDITPQPREPVMFYFVGAGYMANEHGKGLLVDFKITKDGYGLAGSASIDGKSYYVKGSVVGASVSNFGMSVDLIEFNVISMKNGDVVGTFKGNLEHYENFKVMKGTLYEFQGKSWKLTAFGRLNDSTPGILIEPAHDVVVTGTGYAKDSISIGKAPYYW